MQELGAGIAPATKNIFLPAPKTVFLVVGGSISHSILTLGEV